MWARGERQRTAFLPSVYSLSARGKSIGYMEQHFRINALERGEGQGQLLPTAPGELPSAILPVAQRGIAARWLRAFWRSLEGAGFEKGFTTRDFVRLVAVPLAEVDAGGQVVRLFDLVPAAHRGPATVFISHAWDDTFAKLKEAVKRHCLEDFVWLDTFAIAQRHSTAQDFDVGSIASTVRQIANTKLVVDVWGPTKGRGLTPLTRSWCMYEVANTPHERLSLISPPSVGGLTKEQHEAAFRCCAALSARDAQSREAEDKQKIDADMLRHFGSWEQADYVLQGLVIRSLRHTPVHKASKELTTDNDREAFLAQLWRLPSEPPPHAAMKGESTGARPAKRHRSAAATETNDSALVAPANSSSTSSE